MTAGQQYNLRKLFLSKKWFESSSVITLRGARLVADGALPLVGEVDDVGVPDPGAVVLEDLITVLALQAEHLVLVRDPDVLPQRPLVAASLPAVLAEVALTCEIS